MTDSAPLKCVWEGDVFRPSSPFWARKADQQFVIGQTYKLQEYDDRSSRSHRFFFACVGATWDNLSDEQRRRWPSPDALRYWALIQSGWCDSQTLVLSSNEVAETVAAFMRPIDKYAIVEVRDNIVIHYTAHSQAKGKMDKEKFRKSADDVLRVLSEELGVSVEQLGQAAREAA